jgi:hypothetical protein
MRRIMLSSETLSHISENQDVSGTLQAVAASPAVSVSNLQDEFHILFFP